MSDVLCKLDHARRLHQQGRQRLALWTIAEVAERLRTEPAMPVDTLIDLLCLRKRVVQAMREG